MEEKVMLDVSAKLTAEAPGARYTQLFKRHKWDGKVRLMGQHRYFSAGLVPCVFDLLGQAKIVPVLEDLRGVVTPTLVTPTVPVRDYQWAAITAAFQNTFQNLWWPRGVLHMATGAGKTEVAAAMVQMVTAPTLFLVHRRDLLFQTKDRFEKYGISCGVLGDGQSNIQTVTVATMQTIASLIRKGGDLSFLDTIEQVFFDEAHLLAATTDKGNLFTKIANLTPNAFMRWGLTATPFMRDKYSNWLLEGVTGPSLYQIKNKELIDQNFLTPPRVKILPSAPVKGVPNEWPNCYDSGIVLNAGRNRQILDIMDICAKPCLIFVTQVAHGKILEMESKKRGKPVIFLHGENSTADRRLVFDAVKAGKIDKLIISTIGDEGLDIPNLRSLVMAGAGKSQIKMLQRIGRGLRLAANKHEVEVYDFKDESCRILKKHSQARKAVWEEEGFKIDE